MKSTINPVFRSLNRPLLIFEIQRGLALFLISSSVGLFELSGALAPALLMFIALWAGARFVGHLDPQLLRIVLNSRQFGTRYDPAKRSPFDAKGGA
jgi:type IV secretory pathway VirB3-like protein